jgi:hypothetical protein
MLWQIDWTDIAKSPNVIHAFEDDGILHDSSLATCVIKLQQEYVIHEENINKTIQHLRGIDNIQIDVFK